MLNLITSRAVALYSIGFKAATRRGHDFNSARRAGLACERAYIANEIKRACATVDLSFYAVDGIIVSD